VATQSADGPNAALFLLTSNDLHRFHVLGDHVNGIRNHTQWPDERNAAPVRLLRPIWTVFTP
jgi:hypothetical protein